MLIDNEGSNPVTGMFAGGPNYTASNDPRYIFNVNTAGGDGNDVVLTVVAVQPTVVDVTPAGLVQFSWTWGSTTLSAWASPVRTMSSRAASTVIGLTPAAKSLGWTGSGTNTVTGPTLGVTGLSIATADGNDVITDLTAGVPTTIIALGT